MIEIDTSRYFHSILVSCIPLNAMISSRYEAVIKADNFSADHVIDD